MYVINDLNGEEAVEIFCCENKKCKKKIDRRLALNKVIKKKGGKQNAKLKNCDAYFNSWIETKIIAMQNELFCATIYR